MNPIGLIAAALLVVAGVRLLRKWDRVYQLGRSNPHRLLAGLSCLVSAFVISHYSLPALAAHL